MTKSLVVDASLSVRLILPDPQRGVLRTRMEQFVQEGCALYAPGLWLYEMTTALCKAAFFGLVTADEAQQSLPLVHEMGIQLVAPDAEQARLAFAWTLRLNRAAAYDSFYLALAESLGCELWTADQRLCNAVDLPWVRLAGDLSRNFNKSLTRL
jgi:predicted nucleic acid-binding protein